MKKTVAVLMAALMLLALTSCGRVEPAAAPAPAAEPDAAVEPVVVPAPAAESSEAEPAEAAESVGFDTSLVKTPILVTSAGQGGDDDTVGLFLNMCSGVQYESKSSAEAADLDGVGTLIVAVGASNKGLGGAGISAADELARVESLLKAAKEKGITVIVSHTGGEGRRGTTSDQFIDAVLPFADYMIVVATGDNDGKFSNFCSENGIPITVVGSTKDAIGVYQSLFT